MFSHAEELWPILDAIRKGGYLPMLLLVRDPDGPLAEHPMHPPIITEIHVAHMDQLKEMVNRWQCKYYKINLVHIWFNFQREVWVGGERGHVCVEGGG